MAKPVKIIVWMLAFAVAAGAGAFMASRANPFPPGVEDPGARPTPRATSGPPAGPVVWGFSMTSKTEHQLHEGGVCRSDWVTKGFIVIQPNGKATGTANAKVLPGAGCDFAQSQVQMKGLQTDISGRLAASSLQIAFEVAQTYPVGAHDLGGFVVTLPSMDVSVLLQADRGDVFEKASVPDGDRGVYLSENQVHLTLQ